LKKTGRFKGDSISTNKHSSFLGVQLTSDFPNNQHTSEDPDRYSQQTFVIVPHVEEQDDPDDDLRQALERLRHEKLRLEKIQEIENMH